MNPNDPNIQSVELAATALGPLRKELVLVGGCAVGLLITDSARPPVRQTIDVDLVAEVASLTQYYSLCDKLRTCGFKESVSANQMCRWTNGQLILDVMPSEQSVLGHSTNRWYSLAVRNAEEVILPSGLKILLISPPLFLATKLEAFYDRADGDYGHHDMEDIINVVDGRPEIVGEVSVSPPEILKYLRAEFDELLADESFTDGMPRHLRPDAASQARVPIIVERLRQLAGL